MFFRNRNVTIDLIYNKFNLSKCLPKYRVDTIYLPKTKHWLSTIDVSLKSNKTLKSYAILAKLIYECFAGTVFVVMARDGCAFVAAVGFLNEM